MKIKILSLLLFIFTLSPAASAQQAEVTISLNEQFFDALLDAVFQNSPPIEFPLGALTDEASPQRTPATCGAVRILREMGGVRTAVRFREGRIYAPLAFSGSYSPPFIGCVEFSGWAESMIDLQFDERGQRLVARAHIQNVSLNGAGGIGGTLIARMLQSSIDKKINPIEVVKLDKLSFMVPIRNSNSLRMRATRMRHDVMAGAVNVRVGVEFLKN